MWEWWHELLKCTQMLTMQNRWYHPFRPREALSSNKSIINHIRMVREICTILAIVSPISVPCRICLGPACEARFSFTEPLSSMVHCKWYLPVAHILLPSVSAFLFQPQQSSKRHSCVSTNLSSQFVLKCTLTLWQT